MYLVGSYEASNLYLYKRFGVSNLLGLTRWVRNKRFHVDKS